MSIYDYSLPTPRNGDVSLKEFEGKVMLIVNTATGCGFTP
ncbi:MAG TPA: glutathione peroxidase, partial [Erysipelotrichaceae bacterium]|nr:glutathione peroxidase [Erysipelotrichaceae bacterium]